MPSSRVLPEANSYLHQIRPTPLVRISLGDGQPGGAGCDTAELGIWCKLWGLGFPVGPSSGLNFAAELEVVAALGSDAQVVTVFPDRMERYISHKIFEEIRNRS